MKRSLPLFLSALMLGGMAFSIDANAAARPCEDVLKEYRAAKEGAKVSAEVMAQADALEAKAVERCNADDDKRADQFLLDAMKLIAK